MRPSQVITAAAGTDKLAVLGHLRGLTLTFANLAAVLMVRGPRAGLLKDPALTPIIYECNATQEGNNGGSWN